MPHTVGRPQPSHTRECEWHTSDSSALVSLGAGLGRLSPGNLKMVGIRAGSLPSRWAAFTLKLVRRVSGIGIHQGRLHLLKQANKPLLFFLAQGFQPYLLLLMHNRAKPIG